MYTRPRFLAVLVLLATIFAADCWIDPVQSEEVLPPLTASYLTGSAWGPEEGADAFGQHLEFRKDGSFTDRWVGPGGCFYTGTFSITKGIAVLHNKGECVDKKPPVTRCVLQRAPRSLTYSIRLVCGTKHIYYKHDSPVPAGRKVIINNVKAIITGRKKAESTTELMFRDRPDIKGKAYTYKIDCQGDSNRTLPSLPKGREFIILARTREMARVSNWKNYWYYVNIEPYECEYPEKKFGWVFGEFVRFRER